MRFAPEGYPFIAVFAVLTVGAGAISLLLASVPFALTLFMLYFFRDPERSVPGSAEVIVSPADGKVILTEEARGERLPELLRNAGIQYMEISIFMSPLDVHVNRSPCDGIVESVVRTPGRFLSAFKHEASLENESISMVLSTRHGRVLVRQVAGFVARRAVCRKKAGDRLKTGERYGVIKFSSRVDLFLPEGMAIRVSPGDRVKAGETIIAGPG